jgi:hypothetical protein
MPKFLLTEWRARARSFPGGLWAGLLLACIPAGSFAEENPIKFRPVQLGTFTEYGKVVEGSHFEAYGSDGDISNTNISRVAAWLTQNVKVHERLEISAGISGLFWYSLPENEGLPHTRTVKFATGISGASGTYTFGDLDNPHAKLQMGYFPYKVNPDARNLGEYLFRSGTYPGYLWTGGWTILNTAYYGANGINGAFSFLDGKLKIDANIFMERDIEPNLDLSPSIVVGYNQNGWFDVGGGAVFSHFIPSNSKKVTPKVRDNAYYYDAARKRYMPLPQNEFTKPGLVYYQPGDSRNDTMVVDTTDPRYGTTLSATDPRFKEGEQNKYISAAENGIPGNQLDYYTYKGIKLMARASVNPFMFLEPGILEEGAGKLYAEVALLGVEDYPFYYEKKIERMPVMFGFNIPTARFLDKLTIEGEYYHNRFSNSIKTSFNSVNPVWDLPTDAKRRITNPDPGQFLDSAMQAKRQDWFWSVYAKKTIVPGFALHGQAARDHSRALNYFGNPGYQPFTQTYKDWYWALRLEFAI